MISSNKITIISLVLVAIALVFVAVMIIIPQSVVTGNIIGEVTYGNFSVVYGEEDYYSDYATSAIAKIDLLGTTAETASKNVTIDGSKVTILGGGTYVLSGELDGGIVVDSADSTPVRLVLNGVSVTSADSAPLYAQQAEKLIISLADGTENMFADTRTTAAEDAPTAALYSKDDLTINGGGTLNISADYQDGIKVNDGLKVTSGTINIDSADDGINANDYIAAVGGDISITCGGDGIKCKNDDNNNGFLAFDGSNVNIAECREGIEANYITVESGDIRIIAHDDGINALGENSGGFGMPMGMRKKDIEDSDIYLTINGGNIYIETSGDGVDSNGAVVVNGGKVEVYGPENNGNSSLDFEYGFIINGGTLIAAGSSGMAELPSELSQQNSAVFYLDETYDRNSAISVAASDGTELVSVISPKRFNWVCVSSSAVAQGDTLTLSINGEEVTTADISGVVNSTGTNGRRGMR